MDTPKTQAVGFANNHATDAAQLEMVSMVHNPSSQTLDVGQMSLDHTPNFHVRDVAGCSLICVAVSEVVSCIQTFDVVEAALAFCSCALQNILRLQHVHLKVPRQRHLAVQQ